MVVRGDLANSYSYLNSKYIHKIQHLDLKSDEFLTNNKANFRVRKSDIRNVYHNPSKKWGMGYYPHDGRVYIETYDNKKKELIIPGNQSGEDIVNWIRHGRS